MIAVYAGWLVKAAVNFTVNPLIAPAFTQEFFGSRQFLAGMVSLMVWSSRQGVTIGISGTNQAMQDLPSDPGVRRDPFGATYTYTGDPRDATAASVPTPASSIQSAYALISMADLQNESLLQQYASLSPSVYSVLAHEVGHLIQVMRGLGTGGQSEPGATAFEYLVSREMNAGNRVGRQ